LLIPSKGREKREERKEKREERRKKKRHYPIFSLPVFSLLSSFPFSLFYLPRA
jgi:hypothetical protein